ncbi:hypothetical protein OG285_03075 [Streptomyces sp. NBC_01471]|uniref:hypothetical protein n=1 Tax=Streptomyces sp. NBC_01471 TaxID=2903879 RepID=UPI00325086A5
MISNEQEFDVVVLGISMVGAVVDIDGVQGFIDQTKHPSWWSSDVEPAKAGDRLHVVVLDDSRTPPRLSALRIDIENGRRVRGEGSLRAVSDLAAPGAPRRRLMSDMGFYVDAMMRNAVLGIPMGAPPEAWEAELGGEFLDDVRKSRMRRDYGLIEIAFIRNSGVWESVTASVQIHRLARGLEDVVPAPLTHAFGAFSECVWFDPFRVELEARGGRLVEVVDSSGRGATEYREAEAGTSVYVVGEPPVGDREPGSLWSIVLSRGGRS